MSNSMETSSLETATTPESGTSSEDNSYVPYLLNGEIYKIISRKGHNVTVKCLYCVGKDEFKGSVKSTGNFHMHIKRKHGNLIPKVEQLKKAAIENRKKQVTDVVKTERKLAKQAKMKNKERLNEESESFIRRTKLDALIKDKIRQQCLSSQPVRAVCNNSNLPHNLPNKKLKGILKNKNCYSIVSQISSLNWENIPQDSSDDLNEIPPEIRNSGTDTALSITTTPPVSNQNNEVNFAMPSTSSSFLDNNNTYKNNINNNNNNHNHNDNINNMNYPFYLLMDTHFSQLRDSLKCIENELHMRNQLEYQKVMYEFVKLRYFQQSLTFPNPHLPDII